MSTIVDAQVAPSHGVGNFGQGNISFSAHSVSVLLAGADWGGDDVVTLTLALVPEPTTAALLGLGLAGLAVRRARLN